VGNNNGPTRQDTPRRKQQKKSNEMTHTESEQPSRTEKTPTNPITRTKQNPDQITKSEETKFLTGIAKTEQYSVFAKKYENNTSQHKTNPRTCDGNFGRPFAGAVQNWLFDGFHVSDMTSLFDAEHRPAFNCVVFRTAEYRFIWPEIKFFVSIENT
jgi:hypothetical protein